MDKIKDNMRLIIICFVLLIITIIFVLIFKNKNSSLNDSSSYSESKYSYLHNYKVNEVIPVYVTSEEMAKKYLADYVKLTINDSKKAYNLLDQECKDNKFQTYPIYTTYLKNIYSSDYLSATVKEYGTGLNDNKTIYNITDGAGNKYLFTEKSIMNYTVTIQN